MPKTRRTVVSTFTGKLRSKFTGKSQQVQHIIYGLCRNVLRFEKFP